MTVLIEIIIYCQGEKTTALIPAEMVDVPLYELVAAGLIYKREIDD